jgi:hypothetical protein
MDLALHARVMWRFRLVIVAGLALAASLSILTVFKVRFDGATPRVTYRQQEVWQGYTTLLVTPKGFPYGRTNIDENEDPSRYGSLAVIYARLATSDPVRRIMVRNGPIRGLIDASFVSATPMNPQGPPLPMITVSGTGPTAAAAGKLATRTAAAFLTYLSRQQEENAIPPDRRVRVEIVNRHQVPLLLEGRTKTLPIVIFLTVMLAAVGLAFILENLRPRVAAVPVAEPRPARSRSARSA